MFLYKDNIKVFREFMERRDKGDCFLTGHMANSVEITSIPGWINFEKEMKIFKTLNNAFTIRCQTLHAIYGE